MWVYVCIGSRVGEKKLGWCIRVQGLSSTMYLPTYPIRKSCIYFLYRRDLLRGKGPIFPLAKQFSFLFCLARFCQIKICIYNSYCYTYIHTYIVTHTKPVCAKITPLLPSVVNCPKKKTFVGIRTLLGGCGANTGILQAEYKSNFVHFRFKHVRSTYVWDRWESLN